MERYNAADLCSSRKEDQNLRLTTYGTTRGSLRLRLWSTWDLWFWGCCLTTRSRFPSWCAAWQLSWVNVTEQRSTALGVDLFGRSGVPIRRSTPGSPCRGWS